ncbi:MAG TPA: PAS and helix-turn-helix domain-containing protein [Ktedonobacterales bacterium]|nr:PAS and helix-turn-helix domain-containing protein [Ktedonobacterales bacterium]
MGGAATPQENELVLDVLQIPGAAFVVNANQQIVAWNDAAERLLGYRADDVLGAYCYEVLTADRAAECRECRFRCVALAKSRRARAVPTVETQVEANDGAHKWIMLSMLFAHTAVGQKRIVHLMHDVTEYHRLSAGVGRMAASHTAPPTLAARGQSTHQEGAVTTQHASPQSGVGAPVDVANTSVSHSIQMKPPIQMMATPGQLSLTPREREVLRLLACGLATDEIAKTLSISRLTARNHVNKVIEKLGVSSRLQAVVVASQRNLI